MQKAIGINTDSKKIGEDIKLQIYVCNALHNKYGDMKFTKIQCKKL